MPADRVLVTGATGFLGRSLAAAVVDAGYRLRALVRPASDCAHLRALESELAEGDVRDAASAARAAAGCRFVVHAAGLFRFWGEQADFEATNVTGTANVLAAAQQQGVERLVHISSAAVAGRPARGQVIDENTPSRPMDAYQRSKVAGEAKVRQAQAAGLATIILRPGAYYGPWGRYAFNRLFFEDPLRGLLIQVHWGRRLTFPAFTPDVARACVAALRQGAAGETYTLAGESLRHRDVNRVVSRLAGLPAWRVNVPAGLLLLLARWQAWQGRRSGREPYYPLGLASYVFHDWQVSSAKARDALGFTATPFEIGARQTLEWYWDQGLYRRPGRARPAGQPALPPA